MELATNQLSFVAIVLTLGWSCIYLLGPGGYGKTAAVREAVRQLKEKNPEIKIAIAATTTVAAEVLGVIEGIQTTTIHAWFGIGADSLRLHDEAFLLDVLTRRSPFGPKETEVLILDEGSMFTVQVRDVMDRVLRRFRNEPNKRFGGLKFIIIGDPLQLPPVPIQAGPGMSRDDRIATTSVLSTYDDHKACEYVILNEPQRCRDIHFQSMLRKLVSSDSSARQDAMRQFNQFHRRGLSTIEAVVRFARINGAVIIAHTNDMVNAMNNLVQQMLHKKGSPHFMLDWPTRLFTESDVERLIPAPDGVTVAMQLSREETAIVEERHRYYVAGNIYEGQNIQFRATHDTKGGERVTVGEMGTFVKLNPNGDVIIRRSSDGKELTVGKHEAHSEYWPECKWTGYPFIAADACTVHLVQGRTIHGMVIFWSDIIGTVYDNLPLYLNVAASRVTDPGNFVITHKMSEYAISSRGISENLKQIWSLDFMREYPRE